MKKLSLLLFLVSGLGACSTLGVDLPAITDAPTGTRTPGKIVWRDLLTNDPEASQRFYGELFGWTFESAGSSANLSNDSDYTLIRHNGRLIGGMVDTVALNGRDDISQWVALMSVADVAAAARQAEAAGGEVVTPPTDLSRRGHLAVVRDAEGALIGFLQSRDGDPVDRIPDMGDFLWEELWTSDTESATAFYSGIGQLESAEHAIRSTAATAPDYRVLSANGAPRVGVMPRPLDDLPPVWVSYIRSENPAAVTARVPDLGGRVIVEAQPRPLGGEVALIAGPSGAGIALQTWPLPASARNDNETRDMGTAK